MSDRFLKVTFGTKFIQICQEMLKWEQLQGGHKQHFKDFIVAGHKNLFLNDFNSCSSITKVTGVLLKA